MNLAVVGCGRIAARHIKRILQCPEQISLAALVDKDQEALQKCAEKFGVSRTYRSMEAAAEAKDIQGVILCLPHDVLAPASRLFIEAGKHVLVEKPMGVEPTMPARVVALAESRGLVFQVGYVGRFMPTMRKAREILQSGALGRVVQHISISLQLNPELATPWWASRERAGGFYVPIFGSHVIDRMIWFRGRPPVAVYARYAFTHPGGAEGESDGFISLDFGDSAPATLVFSVANRGAPLEGEKVVAEKGTLDLAYEWLKCDGQDVPVEMRDAFVEQVRAFAKAIEAGRPPEVPAQEGLIALRVIAAAARSSQLGRPVSLEEIET